MRLPVNVVFHPDDETPLSLASRLARAMAFPSVTDFLGADTVRAVIRGDHDALMLLSEWSEVPTDQLRRFAVPTSQAAGEWKLGDAVFRKEMRVGGRYRFCPHCFADDLEHGIGRPEARPYERASWLTRAVKTCTRHHNVLSEVGDGAPTSDVARFVAEGWHMKGQATVSAEDGEVEVDAYIEGRIAGRLTQSFIDRQEVHVVLSVLDILGWLVQKHLPALLAPGKGLRACGLHIAREGAPAISWLVEKVVCQQRPNPRGILPLFGPAVGYLKRNAYVPAYAEVAQLLQSAVERAAPLGPGDRFVYPVRTRHLHSLRSASVEYGLADSNVRKLLEEHGVIDASQTAKHQVWFRVEDARPVLEAATKLMTTVEVAAILNTTIERVGTLIKRHLLKAVDDGEEGVRRYFRVSPDDLDDFRRRLFERYPQAVGHHGLVPLNVACQRKSLNQADVIEMILAGKLINIARADDTQTLASLLVDLRELSPDTSDPLGGAGERLSVHLSLAETERALSTTTATIATLVKSGVLPTEKRTNQRTRRPQRVVHRKSISAFLETYRSLHQIARGWRRNIVVVKEELDQKGLKPILETHGKIARFYRIQDLLDAGMLPPNA